MAGMIRSLAALAAFLLSGSIDPAQAQPSLGRRAIESRDRDTELAAAQTAEAVRAATVRPDPALASQVAALGDRAAAAAGRFDADYTDGGRSVEAALGSAIGSEAWVTAERAISRLDSVRYDSVSALAALDTLYMAKVDGPDADRAAVDAATVDTGRQPVLARVDDQNDRLDALRGRLSAP